MSSLSGSSSESTAGGLRPKSKTSATSVRKYATSTIGRSNQARDGNPLDRLSAILLDWNILDDVVTSNKKSYESDKNWQLDGEVEVLPEVYRTYDEYAEAWEPIMIKEIQDAIVSKFALTVDSALFGTFHCTVGGHRSPESPLQHLESTFNYDGASRSGNDGGKRERYSTPGVMDLLLISLEPLDLYEKTATSGARGRSISAEKVKAQKVALGLLVANNTANSSGSGGRSSQILVRTEAWQVLKDNCQDKHTSTYTASSKGSSSSMKNSALGKVKSYKLHYMVVESLRSSWREFQALHDLGLNVPLLADILGAQRTFAMAATPPHVTDESALESAEDNPFYGSPRSSSEPIVESLFLDSSQQGSSNQLAEAKMTGHPETVSLSEIDSGSGRSEQNESKKGKFGAYNRTATVEQLVASWKMKGCTEKFMKYLRLKYNPSQLHAIHTAVDQQGFTLVQGPPGTGKTSTILGILNAIHIREYNQYYKLALDAVLGAEGQKCRLQVYEHPWLKLIARLTLSKPRILVVAPSNTAVDNIILRIMENGFVDGNGGKYFPNILRVGVGSKNLKIKSVTLEDLVDKELAVSDQSSNRHEAIEQLNTQITAMIKDVAFLQSMLVNLRVAYAQCRLPLDFELRVEATTGQPYWVDHYSKSTSTTPPEPKVVEARGVNPTYTTIESLPDYTVFSHRLTQLLGSLDNISAKRNKLYAIASMTEASGNINLRELAERSLIDSAHILFTTLNSAGHPSLESTEFCVTVVDEAAQSVEPSVLIALRRGCRQCIMVGDQQQLPATVFSAHARAAQYDRSLFQRLIETGHPYIMLDTQYRMCPQISAFPSRMFYKNQLKNGENVMKASHLPPFLSANSDSPGTAFMPFMFLDLQSSRETVGPAGSQSNIEEAHLCVALIKALITAGELAGCASIGSIGVISFYTDQVNLLRQKVQAQNFTCRGGNLSGRAHSTSPPLGRPATPSISMVEDLDLNTVDGFQGKENDIIIISAVRANDAGTVGFISDLRRLNVGLTRARKGLFVIGHAPTLRHNRLWRALLDHAEAEKVLVSVPHPQVDLASVLQCHHQRYHQSATGRSDFAAALSNYSGNGGSKRGSEEWSSYPAPPNNYVPFGGIPGRISAPIVDAVDTNAFQSIDRNIVVSESSVGWVNHFANNGTDQRPPPPSGPPPPPAQRLSRDPCRDYSAVDAQGPLVTVPATAALPQPSTTDSSNLSSRPSGSRPGSRFADALQPLQPAVSAALTTKQEVTVMHGSESHDARGTAAQRSTPTLAAVSNNSSGSNNVSRKRKVDALAEELEEGEVIDLT